MTGGKISLSPLSRRSFGAMLVPASLHAMPLPSSVLVHEHVLVDFIGADRVSPTRYDRGEVFRAALPRLRELAQRGCRRLQECTPQFLGRDPRLLQRLAGASGLEIWTNTGLYAANQYRHLPAFAKMENATQLARRWIKEASGGVDGVKPRFIKIGVNKGPLGEWDRKLVQAAALTSKETGLTIASHTGDGRAAQEQCELITGANVPLSRFVWVHAQNEKDQAIHEQVARAGAWVEFDGVGPATAPWHEQCIRFLASKGLLSRVLISQDSGWYHVGEPRGGEYRGYIYLYDEFLPRLSPEWARLLLVQNPVQAFG